MHDAGARYQSGLVNPIFLGKKGLPVPDCRCQTAHARLPELSF
jgi:hypothetical protein